MNEHQRPGPRRAGRRLRHLVQVTCGLALLLAVSGRPPAFPASPAFHGVRYNPSLFATGDVVLRRGRDFVSGVVMAGDPDGQFSHAGIVWRSGSSVFVIHTLPAEGTDAGGARIEPLAGFLAPPAASLAALLRSRTADRAAAARAGTIALGYAHRRLPFDDGFDLATDDRLYCTELVWKAFRSAGVD